MVALRLFDLHCDTLYMCQKDKLDFKINNLQISLEKGLKYHPWVQLFAIWVPDELRKQKAVDHFNNCYYYFLEQIDKHSDIIVQCKKFDDIQNAIKNNKCAAILSVEGAAAAGGKLEGFEHMADCGVKMITLTWNGPNELGDGILSKNGMGLSSFGLESVKQMEQLNITVDVSHLSEKGFYDVVSVAKRPFAATHSNSKYICNNVRNLTDNQFKEIIKHDGIVGINFYPQFVNNTSDCTFKDIKRHIDHYISLEGENNISIGADFDGADMPSCITGIEDVSKLYDYLIDWGYSEELTDKIMFKNAYEFVKRNFI